MSRPILISYTKTVEKSAENSPSHPSKIGALAPVFGPFHGLLFWVSKKVKKVSGVLYFLPYFWGRYGVSPPATPVAYYIWGRYSLAYRGAPPLAHFSTPVAPCRGWAGFLPVFARRTVFSGLLVRRFLTPVNFDYRSKYVLIIGVAIYYTIKPPQF